MKFTGERLNEEICRAVGINPDSVYRIIVDLGVGEVARVMTQGFVETDDGKIDRLKRILRHYELKPKGGIELRNPFKRTKPDKPDDTDQGPGGTGNCRCFIIGIDQAKRPEPPAPRLDDLGATFQVGYDQNFRGINGAWFLAFMPSYSWKGQTFGDAGPAIVAELGLNVPLEEARGIQHSIKEDGQIYFYFQERPSDELVTELIQGTQHTIEGIMGDYRVLKAFQAVQKKNKT